MARGAARGTRAKEHAHAHLCELVSAAIHGVHCGDQVGAIDERNIGRRAEVGEHKAKLWQQQKVGEVAVGEADLGVALDGLGRQNNEALSILLEPLGGVLWVAPILSNGTRKGRLSLGSA